MKKITNHRRRFLKRFSLLSTGLTTGLISTPLIAEATDLSVTGAPQIEKMEENEDRIYMVGPMKGYTTQVGAMLSMMNMMRYWVIGSVKNLTQKQLDFQIDDKSNSIGALLYHLAATERAYQMSTFGEYQEGYFKTRAEWKEKWALAQNLGAKARKKIKGHEIDYYLNILNKVREHTKKEFAKRDDKWLMSQSGQGFGGKPTNNYARWFHVCEHESNHRGQITMIKKRM